MQRLFVLLFISLLFIPAARAAAPYRFEAQLAPNAGNFQVTAKIFKTHGAGDLVSAPRLTIDDGNFARIRVGIDESGYQVEVQVFKPKGEPFVVVVFTVLEGKTLIQAESTRLELGP